MQGFKRFCLLFCLLAALGLLCGCTALKPEAVPAAAQPALQLLSMPAYEDREAASAPAADADTPLRVDLWLDASQLMGGVDPNEESLYPHFSRKYREGGFHYRFGNTVGWYEEVLEDLLAAAGGSRTRVLRCGNERLPAAFLTQMGFPVQEENALRSLRRDLLTYAIDPLPSLFDAFSAENMEGSFYALGSPQLNQMARFAADDGALLENPGQVEQMSAALDAQIAALTGEDPVAAAPLNATGDDLDSPLCYALENIDLNRLSVITCDPAALRRLQGVDSNGAPVAYLQELLARRGVFEAGLKVGLYAMQLDYMGQMISFGPADLSEPLIWGRLDYNTVSLKAEAALPMPRILLMLVVGRPAWLESYTAALNGLLDSDTALGGLRGPDDGQLVYGANGQTVVQQPFRFFYEYTELARPSAGYYTQHTLGAQLSAAPGQVSREGALYTATLSPREGDSTLVFSWPTQALADGLALDLSQLSGAKVEVIDSLLLTATLPNEPQNAELSQKGQVLAFRDTLYLFQRQEDPFAAAPEKSPFTLASLALSEDGASLLATVEVKGSLLQAGYYRLRLSADIEGQQFSWPAVPWTENESGLSVEITNGQISDWEGFTAVLTQYARSLKNIPRQFTHAWGESTAKLYKDTLIPDFPPVYRAPGLSTLYSQLKAAAATQTQPYLRCVFDVFIPTVPES